MATWRRIDIAVANAGILRGAAFDAITDEQWHDLLDVDLHGVMRTARAGLRHMGEGGSVTAVSSIAGGVYGWQNHAHYATAKAGVVNFTRNVATGQMEAGALDRRRYRFRVASTSRAGVRSPEELIRRGAVTNVRSKPSRR